MCSISTGIEGFPGYWKVLLCRILWDEGMLGPMGVDCRSRRSSFSDLPASCVVLTMVLIVLTLTFNVSIGPGEVGGRGDMVYVMALQELGVLIRCKGELLLV